MRLFEMESHKIWFTKIDWSTFFICNSMEMLEASDL